MPIRKYIPGTTFDSETIKNMATAFEKLQTILKIKIPDDPLMAIVAKKIVSLASQGISDPAEIERLVIADTEPR
jgi:hypothetical protein